MMVPIFAHPAFWVGVFLLALSLASFVQFGWDKVCARNGRRRVPEERLLMLAFLGGAYGAKIGQGFWRHKTQKKPFGRWLNLSVAWVSAVLLLAIYLGASS